LSIPEQLAPEVERLVGRLHAQVVDHAPLAVLVGTGAGGALTVGDALARAWPGLSALPKRVRPAVVRVAVADRLEERLLG